MSLVALLGAMPSSEVANCSYTEKGAHFYLGRLAKLNERGEHNFVYHKAEERYDDDGIQRNYTYFFNVCRGTEKTPAPPAGTYAHAAVYMLALLMSHPSHFTEGHGKYNVPCNNPSPYTAAWQQGATWDVKHADKYYDDCYNLGDSRHMSWKLLHDDNPAKGVALTYQGNGVGGRSLEIQFQCADSFETAGDEPFDVEAVTEDPPGHYKIILESIFGCPTQCPLNGEKLCSSNGICSFDNKQQLPRCFCDFGFTGEDCNTPVDSLYCGADTKYDPKTGKCIGSMSTGGLRVGLAFCVILLFGLTGGLAYTWRKMMALRLDTTAYVGNETGTLGAMTGATQSWQRTKANLKQGLTGDGDGGGPGAGAGAPQQVTVDPSSGIEALEMQKMAKMQDEI
jgi:hypothetical protein